MAHAVPLHMCRTFGSTPSRRLHTGKCALPGAVLFSSLNCLLPTIQTFVWLAGSRQHGCFSQRSVAARPVQGSPFSSSPIVLLEGHVDMGANPKCCWFAACLGMLSVADL